MSADSSQGNVNPAGDVLHRADQECDRFEAALKAGRRPRIEDHLAAVPEPKRAALLRDLILLEIDYCALAGEKPPSAETMLARFPTLDRAWIADALASPSTLAAPTVAFAPTIRAAGHSPVGVFDEELRRLLRS